MGFKARYYLTVNMGFPDPSHKAVRYVTGYAEDALSALANPWRDVTTLNGYREEMGEFINTLPGAHQDAFWDKLEEVLELPEYSGWMATSFKMRLIYPDVKDAKTMILLLVE